MKQKFLLKTMLLLCALIVGSVSAWAQTTHTIGWGTASGDDGTYTNFTSASGSVANVLSFSTAKNSSQTAPAYNANASELRLYYASDGNGGSITITPADGITITGAVMTTSLTPSVKYSVNGGTAISVTASNSTYTISGISATSSLTIQNANTTNTQLRIKTIAITYTVSSNPTIVASNVDIDAAATSGSITYAINNGSNGAVVTAEVLSGSTIANLAIDNDNITSTTVPFSCDANTVNEQRTATVRLTYESATKDITISQAAYVQTVPGYVIDFENSLDAYVDWTIVNLTKTDETLTAHGGDYFAKTNGTTTASVQTKEKVTYPNVFTCFISKIGTNTNANSNWKIQVSSDGNTWTDIATHAAASGITAGTWYEVTGDIKAAGYTNVYVRLYYDGSTAVRTVDDISLTTYTPATVEAPSVTVTSPFTFSTSVSMSCVTDGATIYYTTNGDVPTSSCTEYTEPFTINATTTIKAIAIKGSDQSSVTEVTATKEFAAPNVAISTSSINIGETATVTTDGPAVTLTTSDASIASVSGTTVTGVAAGSATITATWSANSDYSGGTQNFTVTVTDPNAPGSVNNPYTVAQAIAATPTTGEVYISGIVSSFYNTSIMGDGNNYRYYISDDGTTTTQLLVYKGKGLNNVAFSNADDLLVGDEVVIYGKLTMYQNAPEVASGNYLVSWNRPANTTPTITVTPATVTVGATEPEGTLDITYNNLTISDMEDFGIQYYDAEGEEASEPDWIEVLVAEQDPQIGEGYVVSYEMDANTGAARTAYFKVFAMGTSDFVYSNLITITQAAPLTGDKFELYSGNIVEGDYIIYYNGYAMNTTVDGDRLHYEEVSPVNNVITTDDAAIVWHIAPSGDYWTIYNAEAEKYAASTGAKNKAQMLADGTDDKALWTVSGNSTYEFVNKHNSANNVNANLRNNGTYGFACYATSTGGALSLYKKVEPVEEPAIVTLAASGYATYCSDKALDFSTNSGDTYRAWYVSNVTGTDVIFTEITGTVAAGEGIILYGTPGAECSLPYAASGEELSGNMLKGTLESTQVPQTETIEGVEYTNFGLSAANGDFRKIAAGGNTVPANKAYLQVPTSVITNNARLRIIFEDETTGIAENVIMRNVENENIYNLNGQRVSQPKKGGLYIVNGKKVIKN